MRQNEETDDLMPLETGSALTPDHKCDHGNYIPPGETTAPYCTGCRVPRTGIFVLVSSKRPAALEYGQPSWLLTEQAVKARHDNHVMDAVEFIEQPIGYRLAEAL